MVDPSHHAEQLRSGPMGILQSDLVHILLYLFAYLLFAMREIEAQQKRTMNRDRSQYLEDKTLW